MADVPSSIFDVDDEGVQLRPTGHLDEGLAPARRPGSPSVQVDPANVLGGGEIGGRKPISYIGPKEAVGGGWANVALGLMGPEKRITCGGDRIGRNDGFGQAVRWNLVGRGSVPLAPTITVATSQPAQKEEEGNPAHHYATVKGSISMRPPKKPSHEVQNLSEDLWTQYTV